MHWASLAGVAVLALVHVFGFHLRFLAVIPRSRWLSAAGGVSVAYAVLHLLPELSEYHRVLSESEGWLGSGVYRVGYIVALFGLVAFYGLERVAASARTRHGQEGGTPHEQGDKTSAFVFWLHIGSFAIYNGLIGYLTAQRREERVLFFVALALHFLVNDFGLRQDHQRDYVRIGRWILAVAVLAGYAVGMIVHLSEIVPALIVAFLAGGIILNTIKEELPEERESRFWAFALGAAAYAAILLLVR